jgi:hypothetical protein
MQSDLKKYPLVKPFIPPGVVIAPAKQVNAVFDSMKAKLALAKKAIADSGDKKEEDDGKKPPKMNPKISRDGGMNMGFGGKMKVPGFISTSSTGRLLAGAIPMD